MTDDLDDDELEEERPPPRMVDYRKARAEREAAAAAAEAAAKAAAAAPPPPPVVEEVHEEPKVAPPPATTSTKSKRERTGMGQSAGTGTPPKADEAPWSSRDADLVWDEMNGGEHPRSLAKLGKTPYDSYVVVARNEAGRRVVLDTISGQDIAGGNGMTPGEALRQRVEQSHLTVAQGPVSYDVTINLRPSTIHARTTLGMPAPAEIAALRRTRSQQPGFTPGAAGYPPPPPPQFQQPYQQPAYAQQPPPPPPQQPAAGYGAPPVQPPYPPQPPSHDPEVSHLRTEVAGLSGAVREMMEFMRGERRTPPQPPPAPAPQPPQGFAGAPPGHDPRAWPRQPPSEFEDLREMIEDMRSDISGLYRRGPTGVGAPPAPPVHHAPAPAAPAQPPPVPKGPNGEIWVERVGWCKPVDGAPTAQPAPAPAPAPAVQPVAAAPVAAAPAAGLGAAIVDPAHALVESVRSYARHGKALREALHEVTETFGTGFGGLGGEPAAAEAAAEPEVPEPGDGLPFEVHEVHGAELFGHPVKYTPNKATGKLDLEGFAMSNPGVLEEGAKLVGVAFEALGSFAKRAAASTAGSSSGAAALPAAGVGQAPAQVVDSIPADARDATAQPRPRTNGAGSFPTV